MKGNATEHYFQANVRCSEVIIDSAVIKQGVQETTTTNNRIIWK